MTTLQKISQYYELRKKILRSNEALQGLRTMAERTTFGYNRAPSSGSVIDRVGHYGGRIADLERELIKDNEELQKAKEATMLYIKRIEDSHTETIFYLRLIECLSWPELAYSMGNPAAEESYKKEFYRYIKEHEY